MIKREMKTRTLSLNLIYGESTRQLMSGIIKSLINRGEHYKNNT